MKKLLSLGLILVFTLTTFGQATTPESAAKSLWNAWQANDKTTAAKYATPKAINFIWKEKISEYELENCDKYDGKTHCFYRHNSGGVLNLTMQKVGKTWKAVKVEFFLD